MRPMREQFASFPALAHLRPDEQELIAGLASEVHYVKRQRLIAAGESAVGCWLIREGEVCIDIPLPGREPVVVQTVGAGQIVGWSWLIPPYRWRFDAVALSDVDAMLLDTGRLRALCDDSPAFGRDVTSTVAATMAQRLEHARSRIRLLATVPRRRRWEVR